MKTMEGVRDGSIKPEDVGLTLPTKETCAHCHNEKATGGKFVDWPKDSTEIAHPIPPGYKRGATTGAALIEGRPCRRAGDIPRMGWSLLCLCARSHWRELRCTEEAGRS
jgi:hypothetical protein